MQCVRRWLKTWTGSRPSHVPGALWLTHPGLGVQYQFKLRVVRLPIRNRVAPGMCDSLLTETWGERRRRCEVSCRTKGFLFFSETGLSVAQVRTSVWGNAIDCCTTAPVRRPGHSRGNSSLATVVDTVSPSSQPYPVCGWMV